jgi:hypothetical protein
LRDEEPPPDGKRILVSFEEAINGKDEREGREDRELRRPDLRGDKVKAQSYEARGDEMKK